MRAALAAAGLGDDWQLTPFVIAATGELGVVARPTGGAWTVERAWVRAQDGTRSKTPASRAREREVLSKQREEWVAIRDAVVPLGRWPLGVEDMVLDEDLGSEGSPYGRRNWVSGPDDDPSELKWLPQAMAAASADIDVNETAPQRYERLHGAAWADQDPAWVARRHESWRSDISNELRWTKNRIGRAPSVAEVLSAVPEPSIGTLAGWGDPHIERYLFAWEEREGPTLEPEWDADFYEPDSPWQSIHLLPTAEPWLAPAYYYWWGAGSVDGTARLLAVLREWHERYGAQVVFCDGVLLELWLERPAATLAEAHRMAEQIRGFHRGQGPARHLARALWRRQRVTVFDRP